MCNMLLALMLTLSEPTIDGSDTNDQGRLLMLNFLQEIMSLECTPPEKEEGTRV